MCSQTSFGIKYYGMLKYYGIPCSQTCCQWQAPEHLPRRLWDYSSARQRNSPQHLLSSCNPKAWASPGMALTKYPPTPSHKRCTLRPAWKHGLGRSEWVRLYHTFLCESVKPYLSGIHTRTKRKGQLNNLKHRAFETRGLELFISQSGWRRAKGFRGCLQFWSSAIISSSSRPTATFL